MNRLALTPRTALVALLCAALCTAFAFAPTAPALADSAAVDVPLPTEAPTCLTQEASTLAPELMQDFGDEFECQLACFQREALCILACNGEDRCSSECVQPCYCD